MRKTLFCHAEEGIGAILLVIMVSIEFINVVTRYFIHYSMAFTEELAVYLLVWVTLLGTSLAFREGSHMAVTFLYNHMRPSRKKLLYILVNTLSVVFFVLLSYWGILEIREEIAMGARTEAVDLPIWLFTGAIPLCSLLAIVRIVAKSREDLANGTF